MGARVRIPPPLVFLAGVLAGIALQRFVAPAHLPVARAMAIAGGVLLLLAGIALVGSAIRLFVRTGQDPAPWKPTPELVFSGPYRFTRNPMYVGMALFQLGLGAVLDNLWVAALALAALAIVHVIAVLPEERYLVEKFGEDYRTYLRQVRRYL